MKNLEKLTIILKDYEHLAKELGQKDIVPLIMDFEASKKYTEEINPEITLNDLWIDFHKYHIISNRLNDILPNKSR